VPLHAAFDLAALRPASHAPSSRGGTMRIALTAALIAATLVLALGSTGALAATTVTPRCDATNLRTGPGTTYAKKASVNMGTKLVVAATVSGGSWSATCGTALSGASWYRFSSINGHSVSSLYGVTYVYGATKLFKTVTTPTASPTKVPTAAPTRAPTAAPTVIPTAVPTVVPTTDPNPTAGPASPAPSVAPGPTTTPAPPATPAPTVIPSPTPFPPLTFPKSPITLASSITIYGRGYGHGVGMSQYGAYGRAVNGQTAPQIMATYFKGTTLGTMANSTVRVLVLDDFKASSTTPAQVYGRGATWTVDGVAGTFPADARLRFTPTVSGATTTWKIAVTAADGTALYSGAAPSSIRVRSGSGTTLQLWSTPSAYDRFRGVLRLIGRTDGTTLVDVVNELPMESYLKGVVPSEVPASWPVESVKAQAIAARAYAGYHRHPSSGTFDFHNDTRSQMYLGVLAEKTASNTAISATAGVVVLTSTGSIANTMFFSSDGGWTENNENVFVSSTGAKTAGVYSYLRGVSDRRPDGSSFDDTSPYYGWKTRAYTLTQIQGWFASDSRTNVGTLVALDLHDRGVSGRLISITLIGANGTTKKVSADVFRAIFNAHRPSGDPMMRNSLFSLSPIP
jgi:SpoIID/LytB domain protein